MRTPLVVTLLAVTVGRPTHAQATAAPPVDTLSAVAVGDTALAHFLVGVDVVGQMLNDSARAIVRLLAVRDQRVVQEGGGVGRRQTAERLYIVVTPFVPTEPVLVYALAQPFADQRRETLTRQRHPQFVLGYGPAGEAPRRWITIDVRPDRSVLILDRGDTRPTE